MKLPMNVLYSHALTDKSIGFHGLHIVTITGILLHFVSSYEILVKGHKNHQKNTKM